MYKYLFFQIIYILRNYLYIKFIQLYGAREPVPSGKMEIITDERTYEGVPAIPSIVMAAMESSGIRRHIDELCKDMIGAECFLSPGMAVKAMIGAMIERGKRPLYRICDYYSTAPVDKLFGGCVTEKSLSDTTLAQRLDTIFQLNTRKTLLDCYRLLQKKYGFESDRLFMDATNYTMYGMKYLETQLDHDRRLSDNGITIKESPMPAYGGNAKDNHNERVQLNLGHVVDANGIPLMSQSYDGNTSDIKINEDMIGFMKKYIDVNSVILMADCKLCTEEILSSLISSGMAFVTKVPLNFNNKLKEAVIESISCSFMDDSKTRPGRKYYETTDTVNGEVVRVIAYLLPHAEDKTRRIVEEAGLKKIQKKLKSLKNRRFFCEDDAMDAFRQTLKTAEPDCYIADPIVYADHTAEKRYGDGKLYRVRSENIRIDETKIHGTILSDSVQVLITNIPFSVEASDDKRKKASADDVIELYLEQYKAEAGFKMMKSGMDIANVYIHTPSRITAMAFIITLATMICKTLDHVLKERKQPGERRRTVNALADIHVNTIVKYDRQHDRLSVIGYPGATGDVFRYVEMLNIDPQHLLGY